MLKKSLPLFLVGVFLCLTIWADTGSVLLLYTSDLHDYIKPGPDNLGGMPYVAGYVASVRESRDDILLVDGGDVMEKGDMVAHKTQSRIMYEAMRKTGYNAGAVGNHDLAYGEAHLKECAALAGMDILCLNYFNEDGNPWFPPSKVYEVNGVKVGVIGLTNLKGGPYLDLPECGKRLAAESERLKKEAHLVVVIAHIGSGELAQLSPLAPKVDVFVGGHTHELLREPRTVPETGALILMAGQYARHVGRLDITVDLANRGIAKWEGGLVEMAHDAIEPDREMLAWVEEQESILYPEATEVIGRTERNILPNEMSRIAAAALKWYLDADIAFCHTGQIMRSNLPTGDVDINLLFRTGGQRGSDLVRLTLTGAQIQAYITGLIQERRGRTEWAGFEGELNFNRDEDRWDMNSGLEPDKPYHVVMPHKEWESRFERVASRNDLFKELAPPEDLEPTFTQALAAYVKHLTEQGLTLDAYLGTLK